MCVTIPFPVCRREGGAALLGRLVARSAARVDAAGMDWVQGSPAVLTRTLFEQRSCQAEVAGVLRRNGKGPFDTYMVETLLPLVRAELPDEQPTRKLANGSKQEMNGS